MAKAQIIQREFESILDTPAEQIERPKPLPQGSWFTIVTGHRFDKSSQQQTEFVEFTLKVTEACQDVDGEDLEKFLTTPDGSRKNLQEVTVRNTYYLTDNALYRLKDFCKNCGVDVSKGTPRKWIPETQNCTVGIFVKHRPWQNNEGVSVDIVRTFPAE